MKKEGDGTFIRKRIQKSIGKLIRKPASKLARKPVSKLARKPIRKQVRSIEINKENFMREIGFIFVILSMIIVFAYVLYINGFLVYNAKAALFYRGSVPFGKTKNCIKAKFSFCNGMIKRVICLEKGKRYQFTFSKSITKGTVSVEIQNKKGEIILKLDDETPVASIITEEETRYRAVTKFVKADGAYMLRWDVKDLP